MKLDLLNSTPPNWPEKLSGRLKNLPQKVLRRKDDGKINKQWLIITIIVAVFLILLAFAIPVLIFEAKYQDKFFPGSRIGNLNLAGLTPNEALEALDQATAKIENDGLKTLYSENNHSTVKIVPIVGAIAGPDVSRPVLNFDNHQTIQEAFSFGRDGNRWQNFVQQAKMLFSPTDFSAALEIDEATLKEILQKQFEKLARPTLNARPQITWQDDRYQIEILEKEDGVAVDYDGLIAALKSQLSQLYNSPITVALSAQEAPIKKAEVADQIWLIEKILATSSPELFYGKNRWLIEKKELSQMLEFQKNSGAIAVGLNFEKFRSWLGANAAEIEVAPKDASIEMAGDRVARFTVHQDGKKINYETTWQNLNQNLVAGNFRTEVTIDVAQPKVLTEEINNLGIKEIIGTGESNFSGSPTNRRHNIRNGASKLNGILIKPDEEFSLIGALGPVEANTGYRPELVIKENKTTPEYGGGLCQIGTTVFRAAMASGLPITQRQNHSYNVTYYLENGLPGTDATIYIPQPDVRFINDTKHYVLIQSRIEGNYLYFDFWGTKDGRVAERTKPKVWGWTSPLPTKYVETLDLKPGQKKCTEVSHKGVNASFDYVVTYPDGEVKTKTFTSHYKPWQAVCLVGVDKLSDDNGSASSTEAAISNP